MKNIEIVPLSSDSKKRLMEFAAQYCRNARIYVEIVSFKANRLIVWVEQKEATNDKVLTKKELEQRVREMFQGKFLMTGNSQYQL